MRGFDVRDLLRCPVFEDITDEAVEELCGHGQTLSFEPGRLLFSRGQDADQLLILCEGVVELLFPIQILGVTREVTMERKETGDVVAWSALISPYRFTLSARCASRCSLIALGRETLEVFFESDRQAGYFFMRNLAGVIGRRLQAMQTLWMHDIQANAAKRLE